MTRSKSEWFRNFSRDCWSSANHVQPREVDIVWRALKLKPGHRIFDVPCGDGQSTLPLAQKGCHVVGVDLQPEFIRQARRRFARKGQAGEFRCGDMRKLADIGPYDAVCNWFNSFGYFSDRDNREVLRRFVRALKPGGRLLIAQINRARQVRRYHRKKQTRFEENGIRKIIRWNGKANRWLGTFTRETDGRQEPCRISDRLYSHREFERLFSAAGLTVESMHGAVDFAPYRLGSRLILAVGAKGQPTIRTQRR